MMPIHERFHKADIGAFGYLNHLLQLRGVDSDRLFNEDAFDTTAHSLQHIFEMTSRPSCHDEDIGLLFLQHLAEFVIGILNVIFGGKAGKRFKCLITRANDFDFRHFSPCVSMCM